MTLNNIVTQMDEIKRTFANRVKDSVLAELGDGNGRVFAGLGYVWVRFILGADDNGAKIYTPRFRVRSGSDPSYVTQQGIAVRIGLDDDGEWEVKKSDWSANINKGLDPQAGNSRDSRSYFLMKDQWLELFSQANGTVSTPSTEISVGPFLYIDNYGTYKSFGGARADLASYIPTTDMQCLALLSLDTNTQTIVVSVSTTQSLFTALDATDIQECLTASNAETIPVVIYRLSNAQTGITDIDQYQDVRGFINVPQVHGFPKVISRKTHVATNQQVIVFGQITVDAELKNDGEIVLL